MLIGLREQIQRSASSCGALLFLDFDGVIQTPALPDYLEMEHAPALAHLLGKLGFVQVVVSSSHRENRTLADVRRMLPPALNKWVVGATPVLPRGRADGGRQREIESWLSGHSQNTVPWLALDDEAHLFDTTCQNLVVTHKFVGVDDGVLHTLRHRFSEMRCRVA
jgi:hypothetical protein